MTRRLPVASLLGLTVLATILAAGCGAESGTARCPAEGVGLYDVRDGGAMDPDAALRLAEAGCITLPAPPTPKSEQPAAAGASGN